VEQSSNAPMSQRSRLFGQSSFALKRPQASSPHEKGASVQNNQSWTGI
jgi:hypothetical protein